MSGNILYSFMFFNFISAIFKGRDLPSMCSLHVKM
jgi:hypothetical protein